MLLRYIHNNTDYTIEYTDDHIIFTNWKTIEQKIIKVYNSNEFTWKLNKNSITAINGAKGLFCFFGDAIKNNFMTSYIGATIDYFNI